jgi:hypothetical protein
MVPAPDTARLLSDPPGARKSNVSSRSPHHQQRSSSIQSEGDPTLFFLAVLLIENRHGPWIEKNCGGPFKGNPVFSGVPQGLRRVPLELMFELPLHPRVIS